MPNGCGSPSPWCRASGERSVSCRTSAAIQVVLRPDGSYPSCAAFVRLYINLPAHGMWVLRLDKKPQAQALDRTPAGFVIEPARCVTDDSQCRLAAAIFQRGPATSQ